MKYLLCICMLAVNIGCDQINETSDIYQGPAYISLIDDDTLTPNSVEAFHQVCIDNDIVGTYAFITSRGIFYPAIMSMLHEYEDEGFQVTLHCHEQKSFYRQNQNLDMTVSGVKQVKTGDVYTYWAIFHTNSISVEETHLDEGGNGHIYFNFLTDHYPLPNSMNGLLRRSSGAGDETISYSNYQVREFRDAEKIRADMNTAIDILKKEKFKDWEYFVSPYGANDSELQGIAREQGLSCLVSISNDDHLCYNSQYTAYNIPRIGFNATDAGDNTMSRLKEHIESVSLTGGWLLVGTHIYNGWTDELLQTRFREFVDYAKAKGLKFVTLKEGFDNYQNRGVGK